MKRKEEERGEGKRQAGKGREEKRREWIGYKYLPLIN